MRSEERFFFLGAWTYSRRLKTVGPFRSVILSLSACHPLITFLILQWSPTAKLFLLLLLNFATVCAFLTALGDPRERVVGAPGWKPLVERNASEGPLMRPIGFPPPPAFCSGSRRDQSPYSVEQRADGVECFAVEKQTLQRAAPEPVRLTCEIPCRTDRFNVNV